MTMPMTMPSRADLARLRRGRRIRIRLVVRVALLLAKLPPHRLRRVLRRISSGAAAAGNAAATEFYHDVLLVSPKCAGWRGCLPRSISIALLCRLTGTWPEWCAGVRATPPFAAHAWVEADGRLVGEPGEPGDYRPLMRVTVDPR